MGKWATIQTNFSGGELSPLIYSGRVDTAKYPNGTARMENFRATIQGGAVSAPGSRHLGFAKTLARLIPFVYDRDEAYQIELGLTAPSYIRIWRAAGTQVESSPGVPLELVGPWDLLAASQVTFEQAEDTMFFFHKLYAPRRLQRLDDLTWKLEAAPFVVPAFNEQGFSSAIAVTLSAATVGTGRTFTAASPVFLAGDVGRDFESGLGTATITGYTSTTVLTGDITSAFASVNVASWTLTDSPQAFVKNVSKDPVGSLTYLDASIKRAAAITLSAKTGAITIVSDVPIFAAGDAGKVLYADSGTVVLTFVDPSNMSGTTSTDFLEKVYQSGSWGVSGEAFRSTDVGQYVNLNGGLLQIVAYINASRVQAKIMQSPTAIVAAPGGSWSLGQQSYSATNGYPRTGALWEQRLYLAASVAQPKTLWGSRIGEYLNFEPGLNDADGFTYTINTRQRNPIQHLVAGKRLFGLDSGAETSLRGGNEKAMGPTNIQRETESAFGASGVRPVSIGKEVLFVQGGGRKVRALGYSAAIDGYDSPDRTVFAEHITTSGITDMAYQPSESLLFATRADGQMAVCAYDVGQEVIAWSRYTASREGLYRFVSGIPRPTGDDVWTVVARINPATGGYFYPIELLDDTLALQSATTRTSEIPNPPFTTVTGLGRFEGLLISAKADGVYLGDDFLVTGGTITFPHSVRSAEAGLPYIPTIEMLPPEPGGGGTAQGSNVSVHEVTVRVIDTAALEVNGQLSDFREFGSELLDQPPPSFTGDYRAFTLNDATFTKPVLVIRQPLPFKTRIQAVIRKVTVNDI